MSEQKEPLKVVISGAAGQIGYALIPLVCTGQMFGPNQPVELRLLDIKPAMGALGGVVMEIEDGAYPLVHGIKPTHDAEEAFKGAQWVILIGGFPRKKGMERKDMAPKNAPIFIAQGQALKGADADVRVLVVANPANTNAYVLLKNALQVNPNFKKTNVTALTRLDMNRAKTMLGMKIGQSKSQEGVKNVVIFGNHSATQYPYVGIAKYGADQDVKQAINDETWLSDDFIPKVQNRGKEVIKARGLSSAMSAANAIKDHIHDWYFGTKPGEYVSMGVYSGGNSYGIDDDLIYSFPVSIENQEWTIHNIAPEKLNDFDKQKMKATMEELQNERSAL